jgi:hypothetical protein
MGACLHRRPCRRFQIMGRNVRGPQAGTVAPSDGSLARNNLTVYDLARRLLAGCGGPEIRANFRNELPIGHFVRCLDRSDARAQL